MNISEVNRQAIYRHSLGRPKYIAIYRFHSADLQHFIAMHSAPPFTFTFCFNSYYKTISSNHSSFNLYTDNMTAESFFEPKAVLDWTVSRDNISAIYRDWLHSLGRQRLPGIILTWSEHLAQKEACLARYGALRHLVHFASCPGLIDPAPPSSPSHLSF